MYRIWVCSIHLACLIEIKLSFFLKKENKVYLYLQKNVIVRSVTKVIREIPHRFTRPVCLSVSWYRSMKQQLTPHLPQLAPSRSYW